MDNTGDLRLLLVSRYALIVAEMRDEQRFMGIFRLQLSRRKRDPVALDLRRLSVASEGFSGAEIEGAVVGVLYRAFAVGRVVGTEDVPADLEERTPLSWTRAEDVARLRAWAVGRAAPATSA
ncbi:MAG: hypothetical protein HYU54_03245 [Actinobacteria bacterium]|nr:hypothetical protein [Actinomycetota bacterium]